MFNKKKEMFKDNVQISSSGGNVQIASGNGNIQVSGSGNSINREYPEKGFDDTTQILQVNDITIKIKNDEVYIFGDVSKVKLNGKILSE